MSQRFTREEFYELVWSKPMTHLAKDFRLSDVALHKICKKHDIPNPPLGWWAKRIKHVLTAEEIAEDERRQRRRSRDWSRSDWTPHSFSFGRPEWDYVPTGQLAFEFDIYLRYASQVRRAFKDAKLVNRRAKLTPYRRAILTPADCCFGGYPGSP